MYCENIFNFIYTFILFIYLLQFYFAYYIHKSILYYIHTHMASRIWRCITCFIRPASWWIAKLYTTYIYVYFYIYSSSLKFTTHTSIHMHYNSNIKYIIYLYSRRNRQWKLASHLSIFYIFNIFILNFRCIDYVKCTIFWCKLIDL